MSSVWRLLDTGAQKAPYNMALEKVLLDSCALGIIPNTLHLLEFFPCVLLGYSQIVKDEVNEEFCKKNGIEINRRISGGGAIYMDSGTLGWEIIAKKSTPGIPASLEGMYRKLCGGLVAALAKLGIHAEYRPPNDIEIEGRKICGTGGSDLNDSFIFHGSVLVDCDAEVMIQALKIPSKKNKYTQLSDFMKRTICMKELLGYTPAMDEVKKYLSHAFAEMLDIEFAVSGLTTEENKSLSEELSLFSSDEWIYRRNQE